MLAVLASGKTATDFNEALIIPLNSILVSVSWLCTAFIFVKDQFSKVTMHVLVLMFFVT